jgi:signal transduction histidine kinase
MPESFALTASIRQKRPAGLWTLALLLAVSLTANGLRAAEETNSAAPAPASDIVITNLAQYWQITAVAKLRTQLHRVRMELVIYYCNTNWSVYWGESGDTRSFLPLRNLPQAFKCGDKVLVEGWTLPVNQEFLWDRTTIKLLSESNTIESLPTAGQLLEATKLHARFVETEALVDSLQAVPPSQVKLSLLADDSAVDAYVQTGNPDGWASLAGKIVKVRGVYSETMDPFGKLSNITLWTPGMDYVEVVSSLADDPRFMIPVVSSEDFAPSNTPPLVRVKGTVRSQELGESVTIWDATGQIRILARQRQPLQLGDRIEAIGYPTFVDIDHILRMGLFRLCTNSEASDAGQAVPGAQLRLADQVRGLDQERLAQHPAASLQGYVTYVDSRANFLVLQDSSGGIRVTQSHLKSGARARPGMLVAVEGQATVGNFAPVITNAVVRQTGSMSMPQAPLINYEQAMTGTEDGHWIQMRGYVRKATPQPRALELQLVAPGGEFIARLAPEDAAQAQEGSVVVVHGVCAAIANSRRQLTGFEIWSLLPGSVQTEQYAPVDLFAEPKRPIASLRRFDLFNTLDKRVHTYGTVTLQVPGRYVYLQDGDSSLMALSDRTDPLKPGDQVEMVGFSGNEKGHFLLREAVYRRIGAGPDPRPAEPANLQNVNEDWDGLLVRAQGWLLDVVKKTDETRLILQAKDHVFEAKLSAAAPLPKAERGFDQDKLAVGGQLAVTGVYRIQRDESGKPLSFLLTLRNWDDVRVIAPPPWWTLRRLLFLLGGVLPVFVVGLFWAVQTRRSNQRLQRAQIELKHAHDELEERVVERTRELNEEVEARKRALDRLSEAQQRLIVASRQAGMAEVATGILHNVGNILNSVNVSANMIGDSLQRLRIEKLLKAVTLLTENSDHLTDFLTQDPRGRALPDYLRQLAASMAESESTLKNEVKALQKQVDHIKVVVAWQQDHARGSGFYEALNPEELMEDALQINQAAYQRHGIEVVREYEQTPPITTDRHKVMQILINLLSNAKQALTGDGIQAKRVILRIHLHAYDRVRFEVADEGVGIPAKNLERIFSVGFTTKPDGHGFGLHSGANSAKEMNGRLFATSGGSNCGATFILELPVGPQSPPASPAGNSRPESAANSAGSS